jgi:hypothetical protein
MNEVQRNSTIYYECRKTINSATQLNLIYGKENI